MSGFLSKLREKMGSSSDIMHEAEEEGSVAAESVYRYLSKGV